jgi:anti-anti-sigma factor
MLVTVPNFGVRCVDDDGTVTLLVCGELDRFSAQVLDQYLDELHASPLSMLEIDATELSFCDTAGVKAIMSAHDTCIAQGAKMRVVGLQPAVERVFKLTAVTAALECDR